MIELPELTDEECALIEGMPRHVAAGFLTARRADAETRNMREGLKYLIDALPKRQQ